MTPHASDRPSVLIVGAGIAGLALGRALRARGFEPEIVERAAAPDSAGTGLYLPGNGVRALRVLGLVDELPTNAVRILQQRILDHRGRLLVQIDLDRVWRSVGPCVGMQRADLHTLLLHGAQGVPIRFGRTITSLVETHHAITVVFDDDVARDYDIVVGADGIRSTVRRLAFGAIRPRYVGQVSWRFLAADGYGITNWIVMLARDRAFLMVPVGGGRLYCYADLASDHPPDSIDREIAKLPTLFADFASPATVLIDRFAHPSAIHVAPIEEVTVDSCARGRVVLIGDAAHATSPNMAEGAAMALEDAVVLAETLAVRGDPANLVTAFAERRRERVRWVRQCTHRRDRVRSLPVVLRNVVLRAAGVHLYQKDYGPLFKDL
jgi:2-polyprenyl-6-methoxyphenol hydroxylase-like FAD-dependent oxidoreductase